MVDFIRWTSNGRIYEGDYTWTIFTDDFTRTILHGPTNAGPTIARLYICMKKLYL